MFDTAIVFHLSASRIHIAASAINSAFKEAGQTFKILSLLCTIRLDFAKCEALKFTQVIGDLYFNISLTLTDIAGNILLSNCCLSEMEDLINGLEYSLTVRFSKRKTSPERHSVYPVSVAAVFVRCSFYVSINEKTLQLYKCQPQFIFNRPSLQEPLSLIILQFCKTKKN